MTRDTYRGVVLGLIAGLLLAALLVVTVRASAPRSSVIIPAVAFSRIGEPDLTDDRGAVVPRRPQPVVTSSLTTRPTSMDDTQHVSPAFVPADPAPGDSGSDRAIAASRPATKHRQPAPQALRGIASWFAAPTGTAAAGPALRAALGPSWRGMVIRVCRISTCIRVQLTDWMRADRAVDLNPVAFRAVCGPLSIGLCVVTVTR